MRFLTTLSAVATAATLSLMSQVQAEEWRLGHVLPPSHPTNLALEKAAAQVLEKTDGRVDIKVFPSGQIGGAKEILTGMTLGTHQMAFDGAGILSQWTPSMGVFEAPFLAKDFAHVERMFASEQGRKIVEELRADHDFRMLDIWYYGTRHLTNNLGPVNSVADMADMKVRVPEVALSLSFMKALGATPTPMAFSELYLGLQTGVVDGQENPLPTIDAAKFYEVQEHLALTGHLVQFVAPIVSEMAWNSLSEEDQAILIEAFSEVGDAYNQSIVDVEADLVATLKDKGMKVTEPDRAEMAAAMAPVYAEFEDVWGAGVFDAMAAVE
ncbi:sialic acid TRAP transporter substrate-binding protein SiaP [Sedimentitalea sp. XS_ASV28]|uniref:sialic acid TRAP transporter substrate-binding protein SiaP n=1 Tax=Sedimentitalea sp. XS_ASV28 TaxID=3241296 RepID=UPI00351967A5